MKKQLLAAALSMGLAAAAVHAPAWAEDGWHEGKIKHVLLISIDGLHAVDVANYVKSHKGSALDELSEHGITFSNARTPANSDSFPGCSRWLREVRRGPTDSSTTTAMIERFGPRTTKRVPGDREPR
jgi:hypothetical protein